MPFIVCKDNRGVPEAAKHVKVANAFARVQHPNIIHIYDAFLVNRDDSFSVLVMERATTFQQQFQKMTDLQLTKVITDIAEALQYLHSLKPQIIHRDIKPANIMIVKQGQLWRAVVIDFNACCIVKDKNPNERKP